MNTNAPSHTSVDLSYLEEYADGDKDTICELIEVFKDVAVECMNSLQQAIDEKDLSRLKEAAHKLKGASGYAGAMNLRAICAEAEDLNAFDSSEGITLLDKIKAEYQIVCDYFEKQYAS